MTNKSEIQKKLDQSLFYNLPQSTLHKIFQQRLGEVKTVLEAELLRRKSLKN